LKALTSLAVMMVLLNACAIVNDEAVGNLTLAGVFTDHMVLQRDQPITVWGTAPEGTQVDIVFDGAVQTVLADGTNAWSTQFSAKPAGGPYELTIKSAQGDTQTITDILLGDVFLCSGQSNMGMEVSRVRNAPAEIKRKHSPTIRQFHPGKETSATVLQEFLVKSEWVVASSDTVGDFSASCYFFAREMQNSSPVALGLVHSSWGGSQIEAWVSQEHLRQIGNFAQSLDILNLYAQDQSAGEAALGRQWEQWWAKTSGGETPWLTEPAADAGWAAVPQMTSWKNYGDDAISNHDGLVWYRNSFTLTEKQATKTAELILGKLHKGDILWINGRFAGRSIGRDTRRYQVAARLLKPGVNHILINVRSMWGDGGMLGPAKDIEVTPQGDAAISLGDGWEYKKAPSDMKMTPTVPWSAKTGYAGMYNAMIAPLEGLKFRGTIWYQGESNTRRADQYGVLLDALIKNWRETFGADMPFIIVQLPEYGIAPDEPAESEWSDLREAQRLVALRNRNVGLVVTMGLGDKSDIHPTNKQDVGKRTAYVYQGLVGASAADTLGFAPKRAYRRGGSTQVELTAPADGLVTRSADHPIAFELCGGAPLACAYATATLEHSTVTLRARKIKNPTHVRYCWGDSPTCNLYSAEGLPVGPFQMAIE